MASPSDERKLDLWVEAKRARDYRLADQLRAELEARGIQPERVRPYVGGRGSQHGMGAPMAGGRGGGKGGKGGKGGGGRAPPSNIDPSVGDWHCQSCGNWNWARRRECNQCNAAKEGLMRVSGAASGTKRDGLVRVAGAGGPSPLPAPGAPVHSLLPPRRIDPSSIVSPPVRASMWCPLLHGWRSHDVARRSLREGETILIAKNHLPTLQHHLACPIASIVVDTTTLATLPGLILLAGGWLQGI